jgi:hypothetical protein
MKPTIVLGSASKLFRVLVVGGLSLATSEACSSAPSSGDDDGGAADAARGSSSDTGPTEDVRTHEGASDSASVKDAMTASCIPFDARWDFPDEAGFCAHGLCAW